MGLNAGKGQVIHQNVVMSLSRRITFSNLSGVYSLGWLPSNSCVISSGASIRTAWNGTGNEQVDLGFRASEQGATTDDNAFTETTLDLDAAVGHISGDIVSAANLFFTAPAEVTATLVNTDATAGDALVYVTYIVQQT